MWAWLTNLLKPIGDIGTQALKNRAQRKKAEHLASMALIRNKYNLALNSQTAGQDKEIMMLQVAKPWMRWIIAGHVFALIDITIYDPLWASDVFQSLSTVPNWVIGLFLTIMGFYFAVSDMMKQGVTLAGTWRKNRVEKNKEPMNTLKGGK